MRRKLIIDGNAVYEIDDECVRCKEAQQMQTSRRQRSAGQTLNDASEKKERQREVCQRDDDREGKGMNVRFL